MEDRTFYCLSYFAFCLAMVIPFGWMMFRASRQAGGVAPKRGDKPNQKSDHGHT